MGLKYHSSVLFTEEINGMKDFYTDVIGLSVQFDFGGCVIFACGLTLWVLKKNYPLTKALGYTGGVLKNNGMELCFETDEFEEDSENLKKSGAKLVHDVSEEEWGQRTLRLFDPDGNIIEVGESMPCFCRRLYYSGSSLEEVANKTGIPVSDVTSYIKDGKQPI